MIQAVNTLPTLGPSRATAPGPATMEATGGRIIISSNVPYPNIFYYPDNCTKNKGIRWKEGQAYIHKLLGMYEHMYCL